MQPKNAIHKLNSRPWCYSSFRTNNVMLKQLIIFGCLAAAYAAPPTLHRGTSQTHCNSTSDRNSFILLGVTGDLSKREILPKLWYLYRDNQLPNDTKIFGYARTKTTLDAIRQTITPYVTVESNEQKRYDEFWSLVSYTGGIENETAAYNSLIANVDEFEAGKGGNRLFYLALPPAVFPNATSQIKRVGMAKNGWTRVVIEKPFGTDTETANELSEHLAKLFTEDQIYRMDHFLNYEMIQNIFTLRFGNRLFTPTWNKENIAAIEVDLKENLGVEGRGSYFDSASIIRDVMQNHLLQIMSLIAMEQPKSSQPDDIRNAKVELLKVTKEISIDDVVLGQYVANPHSKDPREKIGYRQDPTVAKNSITSTFALMVLKVENERWKGVPFILRAGKGLNINQTEIVIQFKDVNSTGLFNSQPKRNELHLIAKGNEGLQAKITSKVPGYSDDIEEIALDFTYAEAHKGVRIPDAYQKSIRDVFQGSQLHFVRKDEVVEAWRIFTPILHEIEKKKIKPIEYEFGATGPPEADKMEKKHNFLKQ